jgi:spore germination protein
MIRGKNDVLAKKHGNPVTTLSNKRIGTGTAILLVTLVGLDFLDIPYKPAGVGPSGYWCIFIAFALTIPLIWLISAFDRRFPRENLFEVAPRSIGRFFAYVGNLIYIAIFFLWLLFAIRDAADLVFIYMLNRTLLWVVLAVFLAGAGYVAINGLKSVAYLAAFVLIPTVTLRVMMLLLGFQNFNFSHLLPAFSEPVTQYVGGGLALFNYFAPVVTMMLIHPQITTKKSITAVLYGSIGVVMVTFVLAIVGAIGVFGDRYTRYYPWPELNLVNHVNIPFLSLEQVGLLFLIVWLTTFFVACAFYLYLTTKGLTRQFPIFKYRWTLLTLLMVIGVGALAFPNTPWVHARFTQIRQWAVLPWTVYPLVVYLVAVLRKVGGRPDA